MTCVEMLCGAAPDAYLPVAVVAAAIHCTTKHSVTPIAVLPEPAGRPTHGLKSRRSTWLHNVLVVHVCKVPLVHIFYKLSSQSIKLMNLKGKYFSTRSGGGLLIGGLTLSPLQRVDLLHHFL